MNKISEIVNKSRVIFIDLDGTTLDVKKNGYRWISDANLISIRRAKNLNKKIVISTGRMGKNLEQYFDLVKPEFAICGNGAQLMDKNKRIIKEQKISIKDMLLLFKFAKKNKLVFKIDDGEKAFGAFTWFQKMISKKFNFTPIEGYHFEMHVEHHKLVLWGKFKRKMSKKLALLRKQFPNLSIVTSSRGYTIEVTAQGATKGKLAEFVSTKMLALDKEQTVHIGDTMNDSTTIGHVGALIVMGNATKDLKTLATCIGPNFSNGGLSKILNEIK